MADINWYQSNGKCSEGSSSKSERIISLYSLADVQLRFLCPEDLDEVRALCQEWFPIEYPFYWYEQITSTSGKFYSLAAVYNHQIIGLIVAKIKAYENLNDEDKGILAKSLSDSEIAYILSLGVLKEYRRNGIASLLLDSLLKQLVTPERRRVKAVFLHVLTTNSAAIMFYEQKKFRLHRFLPYYYSIKGKCKDGFMYVLYINGGHPPWTIYDYVQFMCSKVINGVGLFPWMVFQINRALHWVWREPKSNDHENH
ncbi:N-alpha-acetyltransferase 60 [Diabrotica undecimpunctata]